MRIRTAVSFLIVFVASACFAVGQANPAALVSLPHLQVGAEFSGFDTDVVKIPHPFEYGIGAFADYALFGPLGVEVEGRTIHFNEQYNVRQDTIMGGVRYVVNTNGLSSHRMFPYAKLLGGLGSADFPQGTEGAAPLRQHDTFPAFALGAGLDYRLRSRITLRAEFDYEYWLHYGKGSGTTSTGPINPTGFSIGAAYRFY